MIERRWRGDTRASAVRERAACEAISRRRRFTVAWLLLTLAPPIVGMHYAFAILHSEETLRQPLALFLLSIVGAGPAYALVVLPLHELAHYLTARLFGYRPQLVLEYRNLGLLPVPCPRLEAGITRPAHLVPMLLAPQIVSVGLVTLAICTVREQPALAAIALFTAGTNIGSSRHDFRESLRALQPIA